VVVARLPLPDFFSQVMGLIARVVPPSSMGPLKNLIRDTILSTHSRVLTFGILLTLWSASSGFTALIDALNAGYHVSETRRYWKTRSLAIGLTFSVGCLLVVALALLLVGPILTASLTEAFGMRAFWPGLRWAVAIACTVVAVERPREQLLVLAIEFSQHDLAVHRAFVIDVATRQQDGVGRQ